LEDAVLEDWECSGRDLSDCTSLDGGLVLEATVLEGGLRRSKGVVAAAVDGLVAVEVTVLEQTHRCGAVVNGSTEVSIVVTELAVFELVDGVSLWNDATAKATTATQVGVEQAGLEAALATVDPDRTGDSRVVVDEVAVRETDGGGRSQDEDSSCPAVEHEARRRVVSNNHRLSFDASFVNVYGTSLFEVFFV